MAVKLTALSDRRADNRLPSPLCSRCNGSHTMVGIIRTTRFVLLQVPQLRRRSAQADAPADAVARARRASRLGLDGNQAAAWKVKTNLCFRSIQYRRIGFGRSSPSTTPSSHSAVFLDCLDRTDIVGVTRHQTSLEPARVSRNLQSQPQNHRRIALTSELRHDDVADVPTLALEKWIERVPDGCAPHDSGSGKREKKSRGDMLRRRKVDAPFLLGEHFKVPPERHALDVVVQERWDLWRRRPMSAQELFLLVRSRSPERQIHL